MTYSYEPTHFYLLKVIDLHPLLKVSVKMQVKTYM